MADGVLGLGIESNLHSQSLSGFTSNPKTTKVEDFRKDDGREDEDEDEEDDDQES